MGRKPAKRTGKTPADSQQVKYEEYIPPSGAFCPICKYQTSSWRGDFKTEIIERSENACVREHTCANCGKVFHSKEIGLDRPSWWTE